MVVDVADAVGFASLDDVAGFDDITLLSWSAARPRNSTHVNTRVHRIATVYGVLGSRCAWLALLLVTAIHYV